MNTGLTTSRWVHVMTGITSWGRQKTTAGPRATKGLWNARLRRCKTVIEWLLALGLVLALSPVFLVITLLVRRDGGPVFFVQMREGRNGKPIWVYKFRSMHVANCNPDAKSSVHNTDAGVTNFGAKLRQSGLDELPQLFNVLTGSMSLIGPRPHVFGMQVNGALYQAIVPTYRDRLLVRPGITGLAQVSGWCGPVTTVEHAHARVAADCAYIQEWSPLLDVKILIATAAVLTRQLRHRPASTA